MTFARQLHDLQEKKTDQPAAQSDGALAIQAITKPEDNRIFLVDKSSSVGAKSLDLGKVDIYKLDIYPARPSDDNAIGPDRRSTLFDEKTAKEVRASSELRFDNFDKLSLTSAEKLDFKPSNSLDTKNLNETKIELAKPEKEKTDKPVIVESLVKPGDKIAEAKPDTEKLKEAKEQLIKHAEEKFKDDPAKLKQFKENMRLFEERAGRDNLSPTEIAKTYKQIDRLLEAKGDKPLRAEQRKDLAEQIMRQAADPTTIDQGRHKTCNMATVESRMYTRNPSDAARLVADVALTGQYVSSYGSKVRVNPGAHDESRNRNTLDGQRSHASEIFQVTAVNLHIDQENRRTNPPGQLRYEQHPTVPGSGDTGERIIDYGSKPPKVLDTHPRIYTSNLGNLRDVYSSITGKYESGIAIAHDSAVTDKSDGVKRISSEKELNAALAEAKKNGKMPLIVAIDTSVEPFWTDSGAGRAGGSGGGHVVTITDYSPGPPAKVTIDNQWGKGLDHDASKPVSVHELYQAVRGKTDAITQLEKDVKAAKDAGHPDRVKELDLARLRLLDGKISKEDFEKEVIRISKEIAKMPDGKDFIAATKKLQTTMNSLEPGAFFRVLREQHKAGMLNNDSYKEAINYQIDTMIAIRAITKRNGQWNEIGKPQFEQGVAELMESLKGFTPEEIKAIRDRLKARK
ncbi:MAG: LysM protein [Cyanobacteriota bacterium erpe_2018_sw_21hr_WHONDRS-SW48-000092_B_bin.40]|nr:LysM protein [Cyanobacteriota bacterium erpe_2018_sw_21hr_WHONDRS-SW48-000092_B_bin.40]